MQGVVISYFLAPFHSIYTRERQQEAEGGNHHKQRDAQAQHSNTGWHQPRLQVPQTHATRDAVGQRSHPGVNVPIHGQGSPNQTGEIG